MESACKLLEQKENLGTWGPERTGTTEPHKLENLDGLATMEARGKENCSVTWITRIRINFE